MDPELIQVIELFIAALIALIAFVQHRQKKVAENDATMSKEIRVNGGRAHGRYPTGYRRIKDRNRESKSRDGRGT